VGRTHCISLEAGAPARPTGTSRGPGDLSLLPYGRQEKKKNNNKERFQEGSTREGLSGAVSSFIGSSSRDWTKKERDCTAVLLDEYCKFLPYYDYGSRHKVTRSPLHKR